MEDPTAEEMNTSRAEERARLLDRIGGLTGERVDKFAEGIVITFSTENADALDLTPEQIELCHSIAGRYWNVANLDGAPVYRQEPPFDDQCINCHELFLWRSDTLPMKQHRGWYLTRHFGADMFDAFDNRVAWGRSRLRTPEEPHAVPVAFHVPYDSAQPQRGLAACSYTSFLEAKFEQLITDPVGTLV